MAEEPRTFNPDIQELKEFELRGRETHTSTSGAEIIRRFYLRPMSSFESIIEAIEGSVFKAENKQWKRQLPATDAYFVNNEIAKANAAQGIEASSIQDETPLMYATEIRIVSVDENRTSISSTDEVGFTKLFDADTTLSDLRKKLRDSKIREKNDGGGFVEVKYRPFESAFTSSSIGGEDASFMDYLDPNFDTKIVFIPNPEGLMVKTGAAGFLTPSDIQIQPEAAMPIALPIVDFTIRRSLCPYVPWKTIAAHTNKVNDKDWTPKNTNLPGGATGAAGESTGFKKETVKFAGPISIRRGLSSATRNSFGRPTTWFEIIYLFQWINLDSKELYLDGEQEEGPVTWQHMFLSPKWLPLGLGKSGAIGNTGWHKIFKRILIDQELPFGLPDIQVGVGLNELYETTEQAKEFLNDFDSDFFTADGTFNDLFNINAP